MNHVTSLRRAFPRIPTRTRTWLRLVQGCLLLCLAAPLLAPAQSPLGPMVFSVGTSWREAGNGRDWGYVLWLGNDNRLLLGRSFAIYAKSGDAGSPTLYRRVALVQSQTDPLVIAPLLQRAAAIGDNLPGLESELNEAFRKFVPANATLAEKISAAIRGAIGDETHFGRLTLLARSHPAMAMALGIAHAEPIGPGLTTFELRQYNPATKDDQHVVGRVTVEAGVPLVLPAPGQPVLLPEPGPTGDMNAKIRWATPDDLRRVSLLQNGFDVWRVRRDFAESALRQWHITPPPPDILLNYAQSTSAVRKLTQDNPVLVGKQFTGADVANFDPVSGDATTAHYIDADLRGLPGADTGDFANGAEFYYFVAARDVLGRDGQVSPGRLARICDRLFPDALTGVEVDNDYVFTNGAPQHHLRVSWPRSANAPGDEETIQRYWVYRWTNVNELRLRMDQPTNNLIAIVNHVPGPSRLSYLDAGPGSPGAGEMGRTFYYTVRAEDSGACGGNLSPHSGPVAGVLRDREGPPRGTGSVGGNCYDPAAAVVIAGTAFLLNATPDLVLRVYRIRSSSRIAWMEVEVTVRIPDSTNIVGRFTAPRHYFARGENTNGYNFNIPVGFSDREMTVAIRAGHIDGRVAQNFRVSTINWTPQQVMSAFALAGLIPGRNPDCGVHDPINPESGGFQPIDVTVQPSAGSRELRLYRRIDGGPLSLVCQKTWSPTNSSPLHCLDDGFPAATTEVCYFVQMFDEHGNGSPLTELGCKTVLSPEPLPKPMLAAIEGQGSGSGSNATMRLRWYSSTEGVDRFEVGIAAMLGEVANNAAPGRLSATGKIESHGIPKDLGAGKYPDSNDNDFKIFRTPKVGRGSGFGEGAAFSVDVNVQAGVRYVVFVRGRGRDGTAGPESNLEGFKWVPKTNVDETNAPAGTLPTVAWPARALPPVGTNSFAAPFTALWETNAINGHIGAVITLGSWVETNSNSSIGNSFFGVRPQVLKGTTNPMEYFETNQIGETAYPLVLYRYQTPSARFPTVSGDLVQASPLLEQVAFQQTYTNGVPHAVIHDPFVLFDGARLNFASISISLFNAYLKDTQPVIRGARYRYLIVRFRPDREIAEVIPTNELEVP